MRRRVAAQHAGQHVDADRVEAGERLVEHEQLGVVDERRRQLDALLVAERQRLDAVVGALGDAEPLEPARRPRRAPRPACGPVQAGEVDELVARPASSGTGRAPPACSRSAARARRVDRPAAPAHLARVGVEHAEHDPHRRGLAGAVGPTKPNSCPADDEREPSSATASPKRRRRSSARARRGQVGHGFQHRFGHVHGSQPFRRSSPGTCRPIPTRWNSNAATELPDLDDELVPR